MQSEISPRLRRRPVQRPPALPRLSRDPDTDPDHMRSVDGVGKNESGVACATGHARRFRVEDQAARADGGATLTRGFEHGDL